LQAGPLAVSVIAGNIPLPPQFLHVAGSFELAFALPASLVGKPQVEIAVTVDRVIRPASDPRDFGLAFGTFDVK
jgi:hypothetical protein